jgi:hypothetical protein
MLLTKSKKELTLRVFSVYDFLSESGKTISAYGK